MTPLWRGTELAGLFGQDFHADISGVSIDTRTLQPGDLFIALADARDGHDFVGQAVSAGAAAVMVHKDVDTAVPQLRVADTYEGLWQLG
ncbi:MAG: UDP-N-acetylmuramoyl-tripeptide--D-alanyl-D-alanine ligase, partial [Pseudomonadales bacterium]|nr:UDP-N-acetylmuramoyl-tripeptide--D-alanyl-D-alanine ligase [Pseudomonadales bacterium]